MISSCHVIRHARIATLALVHIIDMSSYDNSAFIAWSVTWLRSCRLLTVLIVDFDLIVDLNLLYWSLTKSQIFLNGLSCPVFLRRLWFWTPFLHLKLRNQSISTFFIEVSSKEFFKVSPRDFLMLTQPQDFIKLSPWVWGWVSEIY